jgi:hypothetical protein
MNPGLSNPQRRRRNVMAGAAAVVAAAAGLIFFLTRPTQATTGAGVPTATARRGEFQVIVTSRGELVANKSVQVTAPLNVPNLQIVWMAEQGAAVRPGDIVVKFDASGAERQLKEYEASLAQAQATLDQAIAEGGISAEQDKLDLAAMKQDSERARLEATKKDIVSVIQAEENRIDLGLSLEKVTVQKATMEHNLASTRSKIGSLESQRKKAQDLVDVTRERVARTIVKAPSAGVVNYLMNFSQGWMNAKPFKIGDNVWAGSAIAEIPDLRTLQLKGKVEEIDRGKLLLGQNVRILLDPFPEKPFTGALAAISPLTEQSFEFPPTRSFRAYGSLGANDNRLRPGMNGRMDITVDRLRDVVSVPAKAVFAHDGRPVVLVSGKQGLKSVRVEVLARNPDEVAISGIEAGTQVALIDTITAERNKNASKGGGFEVKAR